MKITLTSSLGNIGKPLAIELIKDGHEVTIVSHSPKRKVEIENLNGIAKIGSLEDIDFMVSAFDTADAVFLMNPPDYSQKDIREYYRKTSAVFAQAIIQSKIKRVILLSSFGAHLNYGTGPILGAHFSEEIIKQIPNIELTILRPTYFYYNLLNYIDMIKYTGKISVNYGIEKFPLVSPKDIATVVAEEIVKPQSNLLRYIVSSEHTGQEVATALGNAIDMPYLKWELITDEEVKNGMVENGIPKNVAHLFTEMYQSLENGKLSESYNMNKPEEFCSNKLADFAKEFAEVFE